MLTRFPVITISREFGSGGREIGKILAQKLNVAFFDYENMAAVAAGRNGIPEKVFEQAEKNAGSHITQAMNLMGTGRTLGMNSTDSLFQTQSAIIKVTADTEPAVIVGRCADAVLKGYTKCVNIFIYGDMSRKVRWVMEHKNVDEAKAKQMIHDVDKRRAAYYNYYTDQKWGEMSNYDLCVKVGDETPEEIAELLVDYVLSRLGRELEEAKEGYGRP